MIAAMIWTWKIIYTEQHLPWDIPTLLLVLYNIHYVAECCNTPNLSRQIWQESLSKSLKFLRKKYFISHIHAQEEIHIFFSL